MNDQRLKILAVDVSALFSLYWHAAQGTAQEFSAPYLRTIQAVRKHREGFDRVAICCDSGPSFRRAIWPSYKANRPDRGEAYREQIRRTIEALNKDGCSVFRGPTHDLYQGNDGEALYLEADDVIGSLVSWATEDEHEVTILTLDKDLCQLVGPLVRVRNPSKGDQPDMDAAAVEAKFGVPPCLICDMLALAGDKSDNYKPIEGVGDTGAVAMIKACGGALAVFDHQHTAALTAAIGEAKSTKVRTIGSEPVMKCLQVATIIRDADIDFGHLLQAPEYETIDASEPETPPQAAQATPAPAREVALAVAQPVAVSAARAVPQVQLYSAEMPYWSAPEYLERLYNVGKVFRIAGCFPNVAKEEQVMVVAMMAHERGIGLATAMQHAFFVNGKLSWSGAYLAMLVRRSGVCDELSIVKHDINGCTHRVKRTGQKARDVEFTFADAEASGASSRNPIWKNYRKQMLYWSSLRTALRQEWPDIIAGHYMPDEHGDVPEEIMLNSMRNNPGVM